MDSPTSNLDPTAPTFSMSSPAADTTFATGQSTEPLTNGQSNESKENPKRPEPKQGSTAANIAEAGAGVKLTGAALKKQKAAEKAARRAEKVAERGAQALAESAPEQHKSQPLDNLKSSGGPSVSKKEGSGQSRDAPVPTRQIPIRPSPGVRPPSQNVVREKKLDNRVPMFSHLYPSRFNERASITSAGRDIHPAVLTLGLQLRDYVICGGNARTVATLLVFKRVIQAYTTPPGTALSRNLTKHLSDQITYLSHARPLSVAQGNSIRWLKKLISALDPDLAENEAKSFLCQAIDQFIREKVTLADEVIAREAGERIAKEGEVILTYGKSSVVEKTLLEAWQSGKKFKVIVADSRPLFEGKNLARSLIRAGLQDVRYCLLSGLTDTLNNGGITKCLLGASAMLGNGKLSSRAGTAMVAMMAKESGASASTTAQGRNQVPVLVLCESIKFTARVALDSLIMNEIADPDLLVEYEQSSTLTNTSPIPSSNPSSKQDTSSSANKKSGAKPASNPSDDTANEDKDSKVGLQDWKQQPNLYLVNLMYDVTPTDYLDMVITELGSLPPSAVPVVNGVHGDEE